MRTIPIYLRDSVSPTTSIADMQRCKYLAFLNNIAHLSGKAGRSIHLEAGGGFAKAIEITRIAFFKDGVDDYDAVNLGLDYLETEYSVIYAAERWKDENKSPTKLMKAFEFYFRTYHLGSEYTPYTLTDGTVTVEQPLLYDSGIVNPFTGNTLKIS